MRVDLNADLGEGFGPYGLGDDAAVLDCVSSANVACGFHAGDPAIMRRTVLAAGDRGVAVGAHPGFADRRGFGRREMAATPEEVYADVLYQIGALAGFCRAAGVPLRHVKPHGALYNMAARDRALAQAVASAVRDFAPDLVLYGLAGSELLAAGREAGLHVASEFFADRAYTAGGGLVPRGMPGAVIADPEIAIARVLQAVREGVVETIEGTRAPVAVDTVCLHGDEPRAVAFARRLREALEEAGIRVIAP
ncbi:MAG: LamB/YcsF family protein [Candidatus Sericytochromatia bacterium]